MLTPRRKLLMQSAVLAIISGGKAISDAVEEIADHDNWMMEGSQSKKYNSADIEAVVRFIESHLEKLSCPSQSKP